jgi:hypothetical protein
MVDVRNSVIQTVRIGVNQFIESVEASLNIPVAGSYVVNAARVIGTVRLIQAQTQIREITTPPTTITGIYVDISDGVNPPEKITSSAPGATLTGAKPGTVMFKGQGSLQPLVVLLSDRARSWECTGPFCSEGTSVVLSEADGLETFLRFHITTGGALTGAAISSFTWEAYPIGRLELLEFS